MIIAESSSDVPNGISPRQKAQSCLTGRPLAEFLDSGEVEEGELLAAIVDGEDAG